MSPRTFHSFPVLPVPLLVAKGEANQIQQWGSCRSRCVRVSDGPVGRKEEEIRWAEHRLGYVEEGTGVGHGHDVVGGNLAGIKDWLYPVLDPF